MSTSTSTPPKLQHVAIDTEEGIAIIKYNRPKNGNALNTPTIKDILTGLKWADQNENVRIVITTGEGKFYTGGLDLLDPINQGPKSTISDEFIDTLSQIHNLLIKTPKILIAAVNGPAPGWGTSSLALHDLVYTTPTAIFFTPFAQWGLCAEACSSYTFLATLGRQKASALILAGARMSAQELESAGLVTKIFDQQGEGAFMQEVMKVARGMVKLPPKSLLFNKEIMMRGGLREELLRVNERELEALKGQVRGEESLGAIRGFKEETERKRREKAEKAKAKL